MAIALRHSRLIPSAMSFVAYLAASGLLDGDEGASLLLDGEASGFSIDATTYDTITPEAYEGGPVGGTVSVGTSGVFASDNVALDSSILTQAGTSPKMVHWDSAPYVRWSPHNLFLQSQTFGTTWSAGNVTVTSDAATAPDGTMTADMLTEDTANSRHKVEQNITAVDGFYTWSIYAKAGTGNYLSFSMNAPGGERPGVHVDLSNGSVVATNDIPGNQVASYTSTSVGNGWYRVSITALATAGTTYMQPGLGEDATPSWNQGNDSYTGNGTRTIYIWGAQGCRGINANPYLATTTTARIGIPQAYDAYEDVFGVLVEPAATNLCIRSEEFSAAQWTNEGTSDTANSVTAPDGATTADTVTATAGGGTSHHIYSTSFSLTGGTTYTASVYLKQGTATHASVIISHVATTTEWFGADFSLTTNSVTQSSDGALGTTSSASVTAVGNGWYRYSITGFATNTDSFVIGVHIQNTGTPTHSDYGNVTWTAAGTETLYAWGAQVELGSVATSYIPTLGSTSTRAKDRITALTASMPYNASEGAAYCALKLLDPSQQHFMNFAGAGDPNNRIIVAFTDNDTGGGAWDVRQYIRASSSTTVDMAATTGTLTKDTLARVGSVWASNDAAVVANGGTANTDPSVTLPTVDTFYLGVDEQSLDIRTMRGFIYQMVYLPRRITNVELQGVTA